MFSELESFLVGSALNLAGALLIVRLVYYRAGREQGFVFSFLAINAVIFFVLHFLTKVELSLGFGFGLFAIFSVLRYRTAEVPIREMTYLFAVIGLAVMNSFLKSSHDLVVLLFANTALVGLFYVLEKGWGFHFEARKKVTYEMIDLIAPSNRELLLADLRQRTGLPVKRVEVGRINFLRDTAEITIYYDEPAAAGKTRPDVKLRRLADQQDSTAWNPDERAKASAR